MLTPRGARATGDAQARPLMSPAVSAGSALVGAQSDGEHCEVVREGATDDEWCRWPHTLPVRRATPGVGLVVNNQHKDESQCQSRNKKPRWSSALLN